jgi:hypothetical protein
MLFLFELARVRYILRENYLLMRLYFILPILCCLACQPDQVPAPEPAFALAELEAGHNIREADRINIIVAGKGYESPEEFLRVARRDMAFDGRERNDPETIDKLNFGVFAIEPFAGNRSKFNLWYFPELLTKDPFDIVQDSRNPTSPEKGVPPPAKDFGLPNATYLIFVNPTGEPQSAAFPSNIQPGALPDKQLIIFGSATVFRYPNQADGMSVVAHELGHSIFNLRDEYTRVGAEFGDRYGHNLARTRADAEQLWGSLANRVDPFYFTWRSKMQTAGYWIDRTRPAFRGLARDGSIINYWHPAEDEVRTTFIEGGGITTTGISWRPSITSLMNNEDILDKSWPLFPPVFGMANRSVMERVMALYSGTR